MKGWREPNQRKKQGISKRMARAFSFMHAVEVFTAKIMLRQVLHSFQKAKEEAFRPKDTRAMRLIKSALIRKLNKVTQPLTVKKAFTRWRVVINTGLLRHSIEKIFVNSKMSYFVAMYRFFRIARRKASPEEEYMVYSESLENLVRKIHKLKDKYNAVDTVTEKAFNRIKDHNIRCSKLIAFDSLLKRLIEQHSWRKQAILSIKRVAALKTEFFSNLIAAYSAKKLAAFTRLRYHDRNLGKSAKTIWTEHSENLATIFKRNITSKLVRLLQRCYDRDAAMTSMCGVLDSAFTKAKSNAFIRILSSNILRSVPQTDDQEIIDKVARASPELKFKDLKKINLRLSNIENVPDVLEFVESPKLTRTDKTPSQKIEIRAQKIQKVYKEYNPGNLGRFCLIIYRIEVRKMVEFWMNFEKLVKLKKAKIAFNALIKWRLKVIGERAKEVLSDACKVLIAAAKLKNVLRRAGYRNLRSGFWKTYTFAFIKSQIQKPINFTKIAHLLRLVMKAVDQRIKVGFFTIMFYSQMIKQSEADIKSKMSSYIFKKLQGAAEPSADIVIESIQSKRVRKSKIKPILSGYNPEDHPTINTENISSLEEYLATQFAQDQQNLSFKRETFDLLSNPQRKSNYYNDMMRSSEMSDISQVSRDSDLKDIKATLSEFKGEFGKSRSASGMKSYTSSSLRNTYSRPHASRASSRLQGDNTYESDDVIEEDFIAEIEEADRGTFDSLKKKDANSTGYFRPLKK